MVYTADMSTPFTRLPDAAVDTIFLRAQEARAAGPDAIDVSIGVLTDDGKPFLLDTVRAAQARAASGFGPAEAAYPPLLGLPSFRDAVLRLVCGDAKEAVAVATTGGTGALAVQLRLLRRLDPDMPVLIPVPTWENHLHLCAEAGIAAETVEYLVGGEPSIEGIAAALEAKGRPCAVLVQAGCHNPTGLDLTDEQWEELARLLARTGSIALVDMAYQGLGRGIEEDARPVRILRTHGVDSLVAWSGAKNHTLYGLRPGLACALVDGGAGPRIERNYASIVRGMHSAAATAAQRIVTLVQEGPRDAWEGELRKVREALVRKRRRLAELLPDFAPALRGNGIFALLPFSDAHADMLRREHKVFLGPRARLNVAGVPEVRLEELAARLGKAV